MDMFEPQDHPNDFAYPGGPPVPPYDTTGYTLAYQMGVKFDRVLEGFTGSFEVVKGDAIDPPAGKVLAAQGAVGYVFDVRSTDSFRAVNRLHKTGQEVHRLSIAYDLNGRTFPPGSFIVRAKDGTTAVLEKIASDLGTTFVGSAAFPADKAGLVKPPRIALWDRYGGSMPSGWTRWVLEQFEFPFTVVYPPELDKGNLHDRFDVLVFNGAGLQGAGGGGRGGRGAAPAGDAPGAAAPGGRGGQPGSGRADFTPEQIPEEFARRQGQVSAQTLAQIKQFVEDGGTVIAIGASAMGAVQQFGLPMANHLLENDGPLPREKFYVPGSVLRIAIDDANPLAHGLDKELDVFFDNDPVFKFASDASSRGIRRVGWFADATPLRSGWAGQQFLDKGVAIVETTAGKGHLFLLGPEVLFRSQPHGTYKLFFNGLYLSVAPSLTTAPQ